MQKLMLINYQSPGDLVMLTAAVRDLHKCYPNQFLTDVRTGSPALWENNPYITPLEANDPEVKVLECHYPLIEASNQKPVHFLNGFIEYLNNQLGLRIKLTRLAGDIHLSDAEKGMPSLVQQITGVDIPYWIVVAGGKLDYTIKWWHFRRWQAVVDHFRGKILFVQIGEKHHYHPPLNGVLDLRGQTPLRELIHLVYHAQGVLCPVTLLMHLAAAVETKGSGVRPSSGAASLVGKGGAYGSKPLPPINVAAPEDGRTPLNTYTPPGDRAGVRGPPSADRPCVVVAGGREPPNWEAYPAHQFLHTIGMLSCCAQGGCWRSRSVPLGDGDEKDEPKHLCVDVVENLPRCMHLIRPEQVIQALAASVHGRASNHLTEDQFSRVEPLLFRRAAVVSHRDGGNEIRSWLSASDRFVSTN